MTEGMKAQIKEALRQLHAGVPLEQVKEKFKHIFETVSSIEIAKIEEEFIKGVKREEMQKLCDMHSTIFRKQLEKQKLNLPPTPPLRILMEEHKIMLQHAEQVLSTPTNF